MVKRALLVGCNYPNMKCELKGCVNDVERMRILLEKRFGFGKDQIIQLVDTDPRGARPTGANIRACLVKLIKGAQPGDVLLFHFSGHGTQVPPDNGMPDDTGYEECIVPTDMNLLTDDDFRELVNRIPPGVNFTFIADSCHSGGLIDSEKEQIGSAMSAGGGLLSGGRPRPRPDGRPSRPPAGGDGLMGLVTEGIEAYAGGGGGGGRKKNPILNVVGDALESRFNSRDEPGDPRKERVYDPQGVDPYGRQPKSQYERGYAEGGYADSEYDNRGSGYVPERPRERQEARGSERGYTDEPPPYVYDGKYMKNARSDSRTGFADSGTAYITHLHYMRSAGSEPDTGYAERSFGYAAESPYLGGYPAEEAYGRPPEGYSARETGYERQGRPIRSLESEYGYTPESAYERPGRSTMDDGYPPPTFFEKPVGPSGDEFGYPPRGASERPLRPVDDDYPPRGASERPLRSVDDDYPVRGRYDVPARPVDDDYRHASERPFRRPDEGGYGSIPVRPEGDPYERYGERKHSVIDPREEERLRYEKEDYARGPNRRESYGEGGGHDSSSRPPSKYPTEYPTERVGKHGGYSDTSEGPSGYPASGSHGYSGKPHHTPLVSKSLDIQTLTEVLSQQTGQRVRVDNIRRTIYSLFGEDASPTVKFFVTEVIQKLEESGDGGGGHHGLLGKIGGLASTLLKTKLTDHGPTSSGGGGYGDHQYVGDEGGDAFGAIQGQISGYRRRRGRPHDSSVLISACAPEEKSADANPTSNPKNAYGALSNAIQTVIGETKTQLSNRDVVMLTRKLLKSQGYIQHPCLYCSDRNADTPFLGRVA